MNFDYDIWFDNGRWIVRGLDATPATYPTQQQAIFAAKAHARKSQKTVAWRDRSGVVQGTASYAYKQAKAGRNWPHFLTFRRKPSQRQVDLEEAPSVRGAAS
jgi:hypothetical protein